MKNKLINKCLLTAVTVCFISCGGGGGAGSDSGAATQNNGSADSNTVMETVTESNASVSTQDYSPSGDKLRSTATDSSDLYVEEDFTFSINETVQLLIQVSDEDGSPASRAVVYVYSVPADITSWSDEYLSDAKLLIMGMTDANGLFEAQLDLAYSNVRLLGIVNTLGIENKAVFDINNNVAMYHFD